MRFWQPGAYGAQPWRRYLCGRLYTEVHQYAADLCLEYGLDTAVADAVTKDGVRTAVQTYAGVMLKSEDRSAKLAPALQEVRTALETAAAKAAPGATTAQVQDFGKAFADYMGAVWRWFLRRICKAL